MCSNVFAFVSGIGRAIAQVSWQTTENRSFHCLTGCYSKSWRRFGVPGRSPGNFGGVRGRCKTFCSRGGVLQRGDTFGSVGGSTRGGLRFRSRVGVPARLATACSDADVVGLRCPVIGLCHPAMPAMEPAYASSRVWRGLIIATVPLRSRVGVPARLGTTVSNTNGVAGICCPMTSAARVLV